MILKDRWKNSIILGLFIKLQFIQFYSDAMAKDNKNYKNISKIKTFFKR